MRDFNKEAATWDEQPGRVAIANNIGASILRQIKLDPSMDVMEFGCGTGLITLQIQPHVHSITGVDNSDGMLGVLNAKIAGYVKDTYPEGKWPKKQLENLVKYLDYIPKDVAVSFLKDLKTKGLDEVKIVALFKGQDKKLVELLALKKAVETKKDK